MKIYANDESKLHKMQKKFAIFYSRYCPNHNLFKGFVYVNFGTNTIVKDVEYHKSFKIVKD